MKTFHYTIMMLSMIFLGSCSKDLGNYDYTDINELTITGVDAKYTVRSGIDTLRIKPNIAATMDESDPSRYEYLWILLRTGTTERDTIGTERDLNYPVRLSPVPFNLYYRIVDKKTGVTWRANTTLTVSTLYSRGLLLMGEDEQGYAEAEMLSMVSDTVHIKHILSTSGLPPLRDPVSFLHTGGSEAYIKLWAFSKTGSYYLDRVTLTATPGNNFKRMLYLSENLNPETLHPIVLAPQIRTAAGAIGSSLYRAMLTVGGDIFAGAPVINGGDFFTNPINRLATAQDERLSAAPYLLYAAGNMNAVMWYDTKNQRFLNYSNFATTASSIPPETGTAFPWKQPTGRTLVYAENTRNTTGQSNNGNSFAIMKDPDNVHHIYQFYVNGSSPAKRAAYTVKPIATDFDKASFYAFSSNRTVVFYAVGNKLYSYDYNPGHEKLLEHTELGGDQISMLKFDIQTDHLINSLYIATYNSATKGTLRRFRVGTNPNIVELQLQQNSTWTGLIKVKDINWRAVN